MTSPIYKTSATSETFTEMWDMVIMYGECNRNVAAAARIYHTRYPLDSFLWGYLMCVVYERPPQSLDGLQRRVTHASVTNDMLENVPRNVIARAQHCIAVNGEHFKHF